MTGLAWFIVFTILLLLIAILHIGDLRLGFSTKKYYLVKERQN